MIAAFFPVKKLRRSGKYVLFGTILLVGALAVYHEMVAAKAWTDGARKLWFTLRTLLGLLNKCLCVCVCPFFVSV